MAKAAGILEVSVVAAAGRALEATGEQQWPEAVGGQGAEQSTPGWQSES